jgi:hypothetical protein
MAKKKKKPSKSSMQVKLKVHRNGLKARVTTMYCGTCHVHYNNPFQHTCYSGSSGVSKAELMDQAMFARQRHDWDGHDKYLKQVHPERRPRG